MFVKILSRRNPTYLSLLKYILRKGKIDIPQIFTHNLRNNIPEDAVKAFMLNASFRKNPRSNQVFLFHEIISLGKDDRSVITRPMLEDVFNKWVNLRGEQLIYYAAVHNDRDAIHIHSCTSSTSLYTGEANRISKAELQKIKIELQSYVLGKYTELNHTYCEHGLSKSYEKPQKSYIKKRETMKAEITNKVQMCLEMATTREEFLELLRQNELFHYEKSNGEPKGIVFEETKFRFTNLDIDMSKFNQLPLDLSEEQQALNEISALREARSDRSQTRFLEFEENGVPSMVYFNNEFKEVEKQLPDGSFDEEISEITPEELLEYERMYDYANDLLEDEEFSSGIENPDEDYELDF